MIWLAAVDVRIWQAIIAGAFVAIGWLVNGWQNRRDAKRLRDEKLRDVHRALYAEIGANLSNLVSEDWIAEFGARTVARMRADPAFVPFVPGERHDHVFDVVVTELQVLPTQTIDGIVLYYSQLKSIAALAEDLRDERFAKLDQDRRIAMYEDYIAMKRQAVRFGDYAKQMIVAYALGGAAGAESMKTRLGVNRTVSDPSDP